MDDLIVIGAGGSGGDIVWLVDALNGDAPRWRLVGFLDDDPVKHGSVVSGRRVLGPIAAATDFRDARFVVGIANYRRPQARAEVVARLTIDRDRFATLIHPSAAVAPEVVIGAGCLVFQQAIVSPGARLGDHVFVGPTAVVSHDAVVENGATLAPGAMLCGGARLGAGAYAGARSVVRDGVVVGMGAVIGLGSVVIADVGAGDVVAGNPARSLPSSAARGSRRG